MAGPIDIAVIGGGIAGHTAAGAAAALGARVAHITGTEAPGGLVVNVGVLDGFSDSDTSGIDLASTLLVDNAELGIEQIGENADLIAKQDGRYSIVAGPERIIARRVILATGARLKMLDVPGIPELINRGVSQCSWCDGSLYRDLPVVVIGGGDAALQESLHLAGIAQSVTIITRGDTFRARGSYLERARNAPNVRLIQNSDIVSINGRDAVEGIRLRNRATGNDETLACRGVFVFIGVAPNSALLPDAHRDGSGALVTDSNLETSMPGIYAVGAVRSGYSGALIDAIQDANAAGSRAAAFD